MFNRTRDEDAFSWEVEGADVFKHVRSPGEFDPAAPVLLYDNQKENREFAGELPDGAAVYNDPSGVFAGKVRMAKMLQDAAVDWVPRTAFNPLNAAALRFPVIMKTDNSFDSRGVELARNEGELTGDFDVYQEAIYIEREFRACVFRGRESDERKLLCLFEKKPKNDKAKRLRVDEGRKLHKKDSTKFYWQQLPLEIDFLPRLPEILNKVLDLAPTLNVAGIDIALDRDGKVWFIEHNTRASMLSNQAVLVYREIYEEFYGRPVEDFEEMERLSAAHLASTRDKLDIPLESDDRVLNNFKTISI
jgi:hypothetical protein